MLSWDLLIADLVSNDFISAVRWRQFLIAMDLNTLITTHAGNFDFLHDQTSVLSLSYYYVSSSDRLRLSKMS